MSHQTMESSMILGIDEITYGAEDLVDVAHREGHVVEPATAVRRA
jgi:hypothetical protein